MDAQAYATAIGVSKREALRRLRLQAKIGELELQLLQNEPEIFGGLYIQNIPTYRVVVLFTKNGEEVIKNYIVGSSVQDVIEVKPARVPLKTLEAEQNRIIALTKRLGQVVHTGRNVADNVVELYVGNLAEFNADLTGVSENISPNVRIIQANVQLRNVADLYGGFRLDTALGFCTSGFSVKKSSTGKRGIATAGHCTDPIRYSGKQLNFGGEVHTGAYDVAWYKTTGFTILNRISTGGSIRSITSTRIRSQQSVGAYVCKYGISSGYACGQVVDNVWDGVNVRTNYLVDGGDSGGPNFVGNDAWGTTISELFINNQEVGMVYSPVDNLNGLLGVQVLIQ